MDEDSDKSIDEDKYLINYLNAKNPAPVLTVGQKQLYKIDLIFLEQLLEQLNLTQFFDIKEMNFYKDKGHLNTILFDIVLEYIKSIHGDMTPMQRISKKSLSSILIFLPGIYEI